VARARLRRPAAAGATKAAAKPAARPAKAARPADARAKKPAPAKRDRAAAPEPFWRTKRLADMTAAEWESLCDGCGRCCLHKLRYGDGRLDATDVACRLLDLETCRCTDYANRMRKVMDCVQLTPANVPRLDWLPPTCGYRLVSEGKDLYWWHPLVSGDPGTVHVAGVSVRGRAVSERRAGPLEHHIVDWPARIPKGARRKPRPPQE